MRYLWPTRYVFIPEMGGINLVEGGKMFDFHVSRGTLSENMKTNFKKWSYQWRHNYAKFQQFIHNHVFSFYFRSFCTRFKSFWEYEHRHEFLIICSLPASGYMAHSLLLWKQYKNFRRICNYRFPIPDYENIDDVAFY